MKKLIAAFALLGLAGCEEQVSRVQVPVAAASEEDAIEEDCGDCNAGKMRDGECLYPPERLDTARPLPPGDTGSRSLFYVRDYLGEHPAPHDAIRHAGGDAARVGGAVVLEEIYETSGPLILYSGVMYTGGGLRRRCTPHTTLTAAASVGDVCLHVSSTEGFDGAGVTISRDSTYWGSLGKFAAVDVDAEAQTLCGPRPITFAAPIGAAVYATFNLAQGSTTYTEGIVIDSMIFDGNARCNAFTVDWRHNNALSIRGNNRVQNSVFFDSPSETIASCGAIISDNVAFDLNGSFVHKSCPWGEVPPLDLITANYVENVNMAGDAQMEHSEGVITFSSYGGFISLVGNVFRHGGEGVFGWAGADDQNLSAVNECYVGFPRLITFYGGVSPSRFRWHNTAMSLVGPSVTR